MNSLSSARSSRCLPDLLRRAAAARRAGRDRAIRAAATGTGVDARGKGSRAQGPPQDRRRRPGEALQAPSRGARRPWRRQRATPCSTSRRSTRYFSSGRRAKACSSTTRRRSRSTCRACGRNRPRHRQTARLPGVRFQEQGRDGAVHGRGRHRGRLERLGQHRQGRGRALVQSRPSTSTRFLKGAWPSRRAGAARSIRWISN